MPSPFVPALSEPNLGGPVIKNVMTLGQLRLLARLVRAGLDSEEFRCSLEDEELEEAQSLASMFEDKELDTSSREILHGFCL